MKNKLLILVLLLVSTCQVFSCKMEGDYRSRQENIEKNKTLKTDEFYGSNLKKNQKYLSLSQELNDLNKNANADKLARESKKIKKHTKKLFPGITPLSN